eukprot:TRINITY_DN4348_c2_g1_i2.p1 TRINITY_DN4348_c2_g1~~TRINITY_DN4348_c2_g1_i2.p1  ORF type:complete len:487 (+),score=77.86 TRINITY_DN4348_c2_g1_i2:80-1540(+)
MLFAFVILLVLGVAILSREGSSCLRIPLAGFFSRNMHLGAVFFLSVMVILACAVTQMQMGYWTDEKLQTMEAGLEEKLAKTALKEDVLELQKKWRVIKSQATDAQLQKIEAGSEEKLAKVAPKEDVLELQKQLRVIKSQAKNKVDTEIARRFAKLPADFLSVDAQVDLLYRLMPESLHRWSCGQGQRNVKAAEEDLRHHPAMHSNLDGKEYYNRLASIVRTLKWEKLENKTFLELGYGIALMTAWLRGLRTTVYATEIVPIPWVPSRHGPFFDVMYELVKEAAEAGDFGPRFDLDLARQYSQLCGKQVPGVYELSTTLEVLQGVPDNSIDISYSLAVLEHISDAKASFKALARVHRHGSLTCHQVDNRDHSDFTRPWEFFLDSDADFYSKTIGGPSHHPYYGNRIRLSEFREAAALNGFEIVHLVRQHETATAEGLNYAKDKLCGHYFCIYFVLVLSSSCLHALSSITAVIFGWTCQQCRTITQSS